MARKSLNLGILAHVDAGKTTLTERLLYDSGVIGRLGAVDAGTTQTDSLPLERRRGITIKAAVASFPVGDVDVNLIDTPGHPDFIAEVDRALSVLDGVVLVVSAVEGVQAQTRVLMRSLVRLRIPALLFVNKLDRPGADPGRVLAEIAARLRVTAVPMNSVTEPGTPDAAVTGPEPGDTRFTATLTELLAEHDDGLLARFVGDETAVSGRLLGAALKDQVRRVLVFPLFFGSALTGAGIAELRAGIASLLPAGAGDPDGPVSGRVFKIERGSGGEKITYLRMFSGRVRVRDRLPPGSGDRVTAVAVFEHGREMPCASVGAGQIGKLRGLAGARIGDQIGVAPAEGAARQFAPPTLESAVVPDDPADGHRLKVALGQLAEQDPLINLRQDDERQEMYVSLYGAVQREVIQATLAEDFGVAASFRETTMICVERPRGRADALEVLQSDDHPYSATVGLRVEPGLPGSGIRFDLDVDPRLLPLYIYKTAGQFADAMTRYVRRACDRGPHGWTVTDCRVTMTGCGYYVGDGMAKKVLPTPRTTAADFRKLTPVVLMAAMRKAGTVVCQPVNRIRVELPAAALGPVLSALARLGVPADPPVLDGDLAVVTALLPAGQVRGLQEQLPGLTSGEGVLDVSFGGYEPVRGPYPAR
ncbi:MAG TPA: translation factor GTPase family protein [Streptosporangiaceae bacterium]